MAVTSLANAALWALHIEAGTAAVADYEAEHGAFTARPLPSVTAVVLKCLDHV